ncbi:MAG: App1 family protein [Flammeovirgaceae bacterium]
MSKWKKLLHKVTNNVETKFDEFSNRLNTRLKLLDKIKVVIYNSYGNENCVYIRGRVLEDKKIKAATDEDGIVDNLLRTYKRLESDEVPGALLEVEFNGVKKEVKSDNEGYFYLPFEFDEPILYSKKRHQFTIKLLDFPVNTEVNSEGVQGEIFLPPAVTDFGVISDVDDTIMRTDATNLFRMAWTTFTGNARTRIAFKGVGKFYEALRLGKSRENDNPFFYVSSSPWNLYDLIHDFIALNEIPEGPLLLRDYGIDESKFVMSTHSQHKRKEIENIFKVYPQMKFVLIGDSGQEDAFIYYNIAKDYPEKILAVYIRDAKVLDQAIRVKGAIKRAIDEGIDMHLVNDSLAAAHHAVQAGLIHPDMLPAIEQEMLDEEANDREMDRLEQAEGLE